MKVQKIILTEGDELPVSRDNVMHTRQVHTGLEVWYAEPDGMSHEHPEPNEVGLSDVTEEPLKYDHDGETFTRDEDIRELVDGKAPLEVYEQIRRWVSHDEP